MWLDSPLLLQSGLYSGMCLGTWNTDAFPRSPSLGNIPQGYPAPPWVASEEKGQKPDKVLNGEELDINLGRHQLYPWCISTRPQW